MSDPARAIELEVAFFDLWAGYRSCLADVVLVEEISDVHALPQSVAIFGLGDFIATEGDRVLLCDPFGRCQGELLLECLKGFVKDVVRGN